MTPDEFKQCLEQIEGVRTRLEQIEEDLHSTVVLKKQIANQLWDLQLKIRDGLADYGINWTSRGEEVSLD
jgi:hypothetical protein